MESEAVMTSISVNGGPKVPIDLDKPLDAAENAEAKEALDKFVGRSAGPSVAADELRLLISRIESLEEEKKALGADVRDVYAEAKARGYDTKTMRRLIKLRKMETHERQEAEALLETYAAAVGLQGALFV